MLLFNRPPGNRETLMGAVRPARAEKHLIISPLNQICLEGLHGAELVINYMSRLGSPLFGVPPSYDMEE